MKNAKRTRARARKERKWEIEVNVASREIRHNPYDNRLSVEIDTNDIDWATAEKNGVIIEALGDSSYDGDGAILQGEIERGGEEYMRGYNMATRSLNSAIANATKTAWEEYLAAATKEGKQLIMDNVRGFGNEWVLYVCDNTNDVNADNTTTYGAKDIDKLVSWITTDYDYDCTSVIEL